MAEINPDVLAEAIREHSDERFRKEFRDWLVYGAPPEVVEIFQRYADKMDKRAARFYTMQRKATIFITGLMGCAVAYVIVSLFTMPPLSCP